MWIQYANKIKDILFEQCTYIFKPQYNFSLACSLVWTRLRLYQRLSDRCHLILCQCWHILFIIVNGDVYKSKYRALVKAGLGYTLGRRTLTRKTDLAELTDYPKGLISEKLMPILTLIFAIIKEKKKNNVNVDTLTLSEHVEETRWIRKHSIPAKARFY